MHSEYWVRPYLSKNWVETVSSVTKIAPVAIGDRGELRLGFVTLRIERIRERFRLRHSDSRDLAQSYLRLQRPAIRADRPKEISGPFPREVIPNDTTTP